VKHLRDKRSFIKVETVAFGVPFAVAELWMFGAHGGVGWWLFLVVLAFAGAWIWASLMWLVLKNDLRRMSSDSTAQKAELLKEIGKKVVK